MLPSVTGFDHFVILVRDIDRSAVLFQELGFRLTERGHHTLGTCNNTIILEGNYFELLGIEKPGPRNASFAKWLERYEGPSAIALQTSSSDGVHHELAALGVTTAAPEDFSRPVQLAGGTFDARFRNTRFPHGTPPGELTLFSCQHLTKDLVWRPEWQDHPNGARRILSATLVHPAPDRLAPKYERLFGAGAMSADGNGFTLRLGSTPVRFDTPGAFDHRFPGIARPVDAPEPWFAGATIAVRSLERTRRLLAERGIATFATPAGGLVPDPACASGAVIEFVQA